MVRLQALLSLGRSRRTETALVLAFAVLALVLGVGAWRSISNLTSFIEASDRARYHAQVVEGLEEVLAEVLRAESEQRGYLVTEDVSFLVTYDDAIVGARRRIERLLALTAHDKPLRESILDIQRISENRFEHLGSALHLVRTGKAAQAGDYVKLARPLSIATRTRFAQIQSQYEIVLDNTRQQVQALKGDAIRSFAVTAAIAAAVLIVMAAMVVLEARFIRALSERLLHASRHDELTGLPNRAYLNEWLERAVAAARRSNEKLALLYLDLNGFKQVNDALGHHAGDEVLIELARRLQATARDADFVARLGGDEFAVIMPRIAQKAHVEAAAGRFAALRIEKGPHVVGASVGTAVYPDDADSAQTLMKVSDAQMYERKEKRKRG